MIRTLRHATLKTGERLRIAALQPPAGCYARAIRRFLEHKGEPWMTHVDLADRGQVDALDTTYYAGLLGRQIVGNVMIVGDCRAGILGHVFTDPQHRRKGICSEIMVNTLADFCARGGLALGLGTGYDSPAYHIYHACGFRSIEPGSGAMLFENQPGDLDDYFAPDRVRVTDCRWEHWAGISLLYMQPHGDQIRCYAHGVLGRGSFEGGYLQFHTQRERRDARAKVLVARSGSVVGAAICQRDARWPGLYTLDLFVHPNFQDAATRLLRAVTLPRGAKVQAFIDRPSAARAAALRAAGFRREATLGRQFVRGDRRTDVLVYARHP